MNLPALEAAREALSSQGTRRIFKASTPRQGSTSVVMVFEVALGIVLIVRAAEFASFVARKPLAKRAE